MCARQKVNTFLVTGSRSQARKKKEEERGADSDRGREALQGLCWQGHNGQWSAWLDVLITISVVVPVCAQSPRLKYEHRPSTAQAQTEHRLSTDPAKPSQTTPDQTRPDSTRPDQRPESVPARGKALRSALLATPLCHWLIFAAANNLTCAIVVAVAGVGYILETFGARHVLVLAVTYI